MNEIVETLRHNELWTISIQRLILYIAAVALYFGAYEIWLKITGAQKGKEVAGSAAAAALAFTLAAAAGFAAAALLSFLAGKVGETPRLAMLILPLALILEKHVRRLRAVPQERRLQLLGCAGVLVGVLSGAYVFMRDAPWK